VPKKKQALEKGECGWQKTKALKYVGAERKIRKKD
jgi:hypothetical protein